MKKLLLTFIAAITFNGLLPSSAIALTASPVKLEFEANPGEISTQIVKLYNDRRAEQTFYIVFRNFEARDESGNPFFTEDRTTGLASWIQAEKSVTLSPLEWREIPLTINIPGNIDPGGYTAAVFGSTIPPENLGDGQVGLQGDVGTLLLLRVPGDFATGSEILEFKTKDSKTRSSLPVDFYYRFKNSGDSWIKPVGDITIKNIFGGTSKIVPGNPNGSNTLSKSIRRYEASWLTSGGDKIQDPKAPRPPEPPSGFWNKVKHEWKHFAFGRYTANLSLTYDNDTSTNTTAKLSFWVIPWHLLGVIAAGLAVLVGFISIIIVIIVYAVFKRRNKK